MVLPRAINKADQLLTYVRHTASALSAKNDAENVYRPTGVYQRWWEYRVGNVAVYLAAVYTFLAFLRSKTSLTNVWEQI